jgi:Domain of unknown function (DUF4377)
MQMKRIAVVGLAGALLLTACSSSTSREVEFMVAPNTVPCYDGATDACLLIKEIASGQVQPTWSRWYTAQRIIGFEYTSGFRYHLLVNETFPSNISFIGDPNPPGYNLKQVLLKTPDSIIYVPGQP